MYSEGIERFQVFMDDPSVGSADRSFAEFWTAELRRHRGEFAESAGDYERAARHAAEAGRADLEAKALVGLGWARFRMREGDAAREAWTAGAALAGGDRATAAWAKFGQGAAAGSAGRMAEAETLLTGAMRTFAESDESALEAAASSNLGNVLLLAGKLDAAAAAYERSRDLALCVGDRETSLMAMNNLACCRAAAGAHEQSIEEFRAIETMAAALGWSRHVSTARSGLAESLLALGRTGEALAASDAALGAAESSASYTLEQGWAQRIGAEIRLAAGDREGALNCLLAAERLQGANADESESRKLVALREALGGPPQQ
jgi:tetratricopeptide (TPR) repeat protein